MSFRERLHMIPERSHEEQGTSGLVGEAFGSAEAVAFVASLSRYSSDPVAGIL
jgi:hypothetical protein